MLLYDVLCSGGVCSVVVLAAPTVSLLADLCSQRSKAGKTRLSHVECVKHICSDMLHKW